MKTTIFKKATQYIILSALGLLLTLPSNAQVIKVEKEIPYFNAIEINDNMSILISQGEKTMLVIEGSESNINEYVPLIEDNILKIKSGKNTESFKSIEIVVIDLKSIKLKGASSLKGVSIIRVEELQLTASDASSIKLDVELKSLNTLVEGAASIKYTGKTDNHKIQIKGAASINAYELETENTQVDLAGAGVAQVNVSKELSGEISGLGSILYKEEPPVVNVKTSGLGTVKKGTAKQERHAVNSDTTKINIGQKEVHILNKPDGKEKKKKKEKFDGHWGGIEIGVNNFLDANNKMELPAGYNYLDLRTNKSIGVSVNLFEQNFKLYKDRFGIVSGLGLTYNNYRFTQNAVLVPKTPFVTAVEDTTKDFIKNKLTVSYLTVPLILEVNSGKNNRFHLGVGVIGGVRLGSHTKQVYEINGSKFKDKTYDDFNLHPFKADATVRVGFGIINLFANYSLTPLFKDGKQPELYPFTVGLRLMGW